MSERFDEILHAHGEKTRDYLMSKIDRLERDIAAAQAAREKAEAEVCALRLQATLPDDYCLACGGTGGHDEGCRGTTGLLAMHAKIAALEAALTRAQGAEADLAHMLIRAEKAEAARERMVKLVEDVGTDRDIAIAKLRRQIEDMANAQGQGDGQAQGAR